MFPTLPAKRSGKEEGSEVRLSRFKNRLLPVISLYDGLDCLKYFEGKTLPSLLEDV